MMNRALLVLMLIGCGGSALPSSNSDDATATSYVDAEQYLQQTGGFDQWVSLRVQLQNDFYGVCGDTFCESDYSNLTPLTLSCAVTAKTFSCKVPVTGTIKTMLGVLSASGSTPSLQRPLPGGTATLYDALSGCLP